MGRVAHKPKGRIFRLADNQPAVLARNTHGTTALFGNRLNDPRVDEARQHHLDHFHGRGIGDAFAVHELGFDVQPRQHVVDHRPAAMDDHRVHTHLTHQGHIAGEFIHRLIAAHRMTAQLDDHGGIGIALQEGQSLAEGLGGGDPVAVHVLRSHLLTHGKPIAAGGVIPAWR